jgi:hypothetical protein
VPRWKAPDWKTQRNAAILAAVRQGTSPQVAAWQYRVPLRAVLGICESAMQRERFAQEHAQSGGPARSRTLGPAGRQHDEGGLQRDDHFLCDTM